MNDSASPAPGSPTGMYVFPASFAQRRLWFVSRMEEAAAAYNVPVAVRLRGSLDARVLRRALAEVVRRHEALRTTFRARDGEPVQVVAPPAPLPLPLLDLTALPETGREAALRTLVRAAARRPFDLEAGPLFRAALVRLGAEEHALLCEVHHIVSDGWSIGVLFRELGVLHGAFGRGEPSPLEELPVQYGDWAHWQLERLSGEALEPQLAWWREQLAGTPTLLELPTDRPRPAVRSWRGASLPVKLPAELRERLEAVARAEGATLFMVLLAGFQALLGKYADQEDLVVGSPFAERSRPEVEGVIGFFVNTLALRGDLSGDPGFGELVGRVRRGTLGAYRHGEVPFERLVEELGVERSLGHNPLVQNVFTLRDAAGGGLRLPGIETREIEVGPGAAKFDLVMELRAAEGGLEGEIVYAAELFEAATIARLAGHYRTLLEGAAADPGRRLSQLPLLGRAERRQVLVDFGGTAAPPPDDRCVHVLFAEQAERTPEATALLAGEQRVSYAELTARAERMARLLRGQGVGAERRVALFMERGVELVVSLLGVLRAGGCYVPVDPEYPSERVAYLLRDSGAAVVLTQASLRARLPATGARVLEVDGLDEGGPPDAAPAGVEVDPAQLAYVIYTSGSTGTPKGVGIPHRALARHMAWMQRVHPIAGGDRVLQKTSVAFDASVWEFHAPLLAGATLVLAPPGVQGDPAALARAVARERITILQVVPSLLGALLESGALEGFTSLRRLFCGGEALPAAMAARARAILDAEVVNLYGPTEVCIDSVTHAYAGGGAGATVPIGRPVDHVRARVLERSGEPVPVGIPGELYLGGAQLARGYLGRPELTAETFVPDPFSGEAGERLYRTGDRVRWLADGTLEFLGRADQQVKIRGFRIEPGEVEAALVALPGVAGAVVEVREDAGEKRLVGYVVPADPALTTGAVREALRAGLPEYMVPSAFVLLDALPTTPSGKVDRRALPAPGWEHAAGAYAAPRTPTEELLAGIWAEVLGHGRVGVDEDFFALGGHSLLAMRVQFRVERCFGVEVPLRALFETPTVAGLARHVETALRGGERRERVPLRPAERGSEVALSFAQQRLWFVSQMGGAASAYNIPGAVRLRGRLEVEALRRALEEVVRRHEALRTVFRSHDGEPRQVVHAPRPLSLPVHDLSRMPEAEREESLRGLARDEAQRPFDLEAGPPFRAGLVRLGAQEHALLWSMHHIVGDGWSLGVFYRELGELYAAFTRGEASPLAELPVQYADWALWQREHLGGEVLQRQLAWWKEQLAGAPALLELPTDRARPAVQSGRGARQELVLPGGLERRLEAVARAQGVTLFMLLLGGFQVLLGKYSGQENLVVGSPIAGRTREETEGLIGFFVNTLALRADLSGDPTFGELLGRVRQATLGAYQHQDLPFEKLVEELGVERSLSRNPLVQVLFALRSAPGEGLRLPGVEAQKLEVEAGTAKFDLVVALEAREEGLAGGIGYSTDLFEADTIARLAEHYRVLLEAAAAGPGRRL
ncbi:MAG: amino acid adenylation domain-containing protein, partial [Longimicrobiaceae bacterium]